MTRTEQLLEECIAYISELESGYDKSFWTKCLGFTEEELEYYNINFNKEE